MTTPTHVCLERELNRAVEVVEIYQRVHGEIEDGNAWENIDNGMIPGVTTGQTYTSWRAYMQQRMINSLKAIAALRKLDEPWRSPGKFTLNCERRDDGGLRITSPEIPGLVLSGAMPLAVLRDLSIAIDMLTTHNSAKPAAK